MLKLRTILAAASALALPALSACVPVTEPYEQPAQLNLWDSWDTDASGMLDETEFYGGIYNDIDLDNDELLSEDEFGAGYGQWYADTGLDFDDLDADTDGFLTEDEFGIGLDDWGAETNLASFDTWDADASGMLEDNEFYGGLSETWDTDRDGLLSEDEFGAGLGERELGTDVGEFDAWDVDDSGLLDDDEFYAGASDVGL